MTLSLFIIIPVTSVSAEISDYNTIYPMPAPTSVDGYGIINVTFGNIDVVNNSEYPTSAPYYGDYSDQVGSYFPGDTAEVAITLYTGYTYGTVIFVDWNKNYNFEADEVVYKGESTSYCPTTLNASFDIPSDTKIDSYRMRICAADFYYDNFIKGSDYIPEYSAPTSDYCVVHDYTLKVESPCDHELTFVPGISGGCFEESSIPYFHCSICGRNYKDAECTVLLRNSDFVIEPKGFHNPISNYTDNEDGTYTVFCSDCGAYYTTNSNVAKVTLTAGDVWGDETGYQMLLDADANTFGSIIPEKGNLSTIGDADQSIYDEFEYKIPENADGSLTTQNIVISNSVSINIPAGTYDWCITNPTPDDKMYIAGPYGPFPARYDNFVFLPGAAYEFSMGNYGTHDGVELSLVLPDDAHKHSWEYTLDGTTFTAHCTEDDCIFEDSTLTLSAPAGDIYYDGTPKTAILSEITNSLAFPENYTKIVYYKDGAIVRGDPVEPGTYTAKIFVNGIEASVSFTILKKGQFTGNSLSLNGDIGINFYVCVPENFQDNAQVKFSWKEDNTETYTISEIEPYEDDIYRFTVPVAAAEMTEPVTAELYVGGVLVDETECSVAMYANKILADENGEITELYGEETTEKLQALCKAMLVYGAKSQLYFNYNTDNLADADLEYTMDDLTSAEIIALGKTNIPDLSKSYGIKFAGSSLLLRTTTTYRLYFSVTNYSKLDELTVRLGNEALEYGTKDKYIYFDISDIPAASVFDNFTLTFGETTVTVNAGAYVRSTLNSSDTLKAAMTSLYRYNEAAQDYFAE